MTLKINNNTFKFELTVNCSCQIYIFFYYAIPKLLKCFSIEFAESSFLLCGQHICFVCLLQDYIVVEHEDGVKFTSSMDILLLLAGSERYKVCYKTTESWKLSSISWSYENMS